MRYDPYVDEYSANLKYRNTIREFLNHENHYVKNNAESCCIDGAI